MIRKVVQACTTNNNYLQLIRFAQFKYMMNKPIYFKFSNVKNHPTIDKILNGEQEKNPDTIFIQMGGLNEKNRELALRLILKKIYTGKISVVTFQNDLFTAQLKKHPEIILEATLFRIKENMRALSEHLQNKNQQGKTKLLNEINESFVVCFDNFKKIAVEETLKHQVMLHKRFADYHLLYLSKLADPSNKVQILKKSRDFYKSTLGKMFTLIHLELDKLKFIYDLPLEPNQKQEEKTLKLNAMKQNIRMLIETNSQNLLHLFMVQKELQSKKLGDQNAPKKKYQFQQELVGLLVDFEKGLGYYQLLNKMNAYSIFYHKLKKMAIQLNYYSKLVGFKKFNNSPHQIKQFESKIWKELMIEQQKLYKETIEDLTVIIQEPNHMRNIQQLSYILLAIRIHKIKQYQKDPNMYKQKLLQEVGQILNLITDTQDKKIIAARLGKTVKHFLQGQLQKPSNVK